MLFLVVIAVFANEIENDLDEFFVTQTTDNNLACYTNAGDDCITTDCPVQNCLNEHNACLTIEYTLVTQIKLKTKFLCATMPVPYVDGQMKCCTDMGGTKDCRLYSSDTKSNNASLFTDDISSDTLDKCFYVNVDSTNQTGEETKDKTSKAELNCTFLFTVISVLNIVVDNF